MTTPKVCRVAEDRQRIEASAGRCVHGLFAAFRWSEVLITDGARAVGAIPFELDASRKGCVDTEQAKKLLLSP